MKGTVEGRDAIAWDCPQCEMTNFTEMVAVEVTDEDLEMQPELGEAEWMQAPETVKCRGCLNRYRLNFHEEDEEEGTE